MTKLEQLIKELCPNGVEYKELCEIFTTRNGYTPSKSNSEYWTDGNIPWFRMEDIRENGNILSDSIQKVSKKAVKGKLFPANSIIVATSATIGEHALITVDSLANQRFTYLMLKDQYYEKYDIKFLYYYCYKLDEWCLLHLNQGSFPSVDMSQFPHFKIPVPPLEVQAEIVKILDNFTGLTAELTAELTARKKQYEYYRDLLLDFGVHGGTKYEQGWQKLKIGDIYDFKYGLGNNIPTDGGNYPVYGGNGICGYHSEYNSEDSPVIGHIGAYAGLVKWAEGKHFVTYNGVICKHKNNSVNKRFAYYLLLTQNFLSEQKGNQPFVSYDTLKKPFVTVPPLEEQERIVSILDRFDKLCNDISEGLPAEIEARRKQYEYYRDKLLSFEERKNA